MKYLENFGYMSLVETVADVDNTFLSRREITCNFLGLGGKLKKFESVDMITKKFKLDGKIVIPIRLKNHVGKPLITGTFYVYDDEALAKKHINPTIFSRLEKTKAKSDDAKTAEKPTSDAKTAEKPTSDAKTAEKPTSKVTKEEKSE